MIQFLKFVFLALVLVTVSATLANAEAISFGDSAYYWPGWSNTPNAYGNDNLKDSIGIPEITGGKAIVNGNLLMSLTFYNATQSDPHWSVLSPGDLFIDKDNNGTWDYVVDLSSWVVAGKSDPDPASGNYQLYGVNVDIGTGVGSNGSGYIYSGSDNSGDWAGYAIRQDHPVAYKFSPNGLGENNLGTAAFSGWPTNTPLDEYTFTFANGIQVAQDFTVGWAMNCANDVIYETLHHQPVPEPATMFLLGAGLVGFAGLGRRKLFKRA